MLLPNGCLCHGVRFRVGDQALGLYLGVGILGLKTLGLRFKNECLGAMTLNLKFKPFPEP